MPFRPSRAAPPEYNGRAMLSRVKNIFSDRRGRKRLSRLHRATVGQLPGLRLTVRDRGIIEAVGSYRALTVRHIAALFFDASPQEGAPISSRCRYRLQLLYQHGYLTRREQRQTLSEGRLPLVYSLDQRGAQVLSEKGQDDLAATGRDKVVQAGHPYLEHLLATNDVRVCLEVAARRPAFAITRWMDDRTLKSRHAKEYVTIVGPQGGRKPAALVPDGYFALRSGIGQRHHFLEVDLGTVTGESSRWGRRDWSRKVQVYLAYYGSGGYQRRYQTRSLRVLTVTTGETRLANLKRITEKAGGKRRFWFSTMARLRSADGLISPIWQVADQEGSHALMG